MPTPRLTMNLHRSLLAGLAFALMASASVPLAHAQPVVIVPPRSQTNLVGTTAIFTVEATGTAPLSYQWRSYANANSFTNIPFGTEPTLVLTNVESTPRRFGVLVTDGTGLSTTSSPLAALVVVFPPSITAQPTLQPVAQSLVVVGGKIQFGMTASGNAPLRYQWRFNGVDLAGQTASNLFLTNVTVAQAGDYSMVVTNAYGRATSQVAVLTVIADPFTEITNSPVVQDIVRGRAGGWGDYDNDGFIDLFVPCLSMTQTNQLLYHNNGDGTFTKITDNMLALASGSCYEAARGDFDNDGNLDLMLTYRVEPVISSTFDFTTTNRLFRGLGGGDFVEIAAGALPPVFGDFTRGASWVDYDGDGYLDFFCTANVSSNVLYRNERNGSFSRVTKGILVTETHTDAGPMGANWADYNGDGRPDVFFPHAHDVRSQLFRNDGAGVFTRTDTSTFDSTGPDPTAVGSDWGDYDNDGDLDLFVSHEGGDNTNSWPNVLLRNEGAQGFTLFATLPANDPENGGGASWGCKWADYDNDGWLDLFVANRNVADHDFLYHNNGDGTFTKVTGSTLNLNRTNHASTSCAWGDFDNDGFMDLFVGRSSLSEEPPRPNLLFHNNGNTNHWIKFRLIGTRSNRSAIGAKVRLEATIHGRSLWQLREVSGSAWLGQNDMRPNFGLADATSANTVRIEWPSGTVQELHHVAANQILTVVEPGGEPTLTATRTREGINLRLAGKQGSTYDIEHSSPLGDWLGGLLTVTPTNDDGAITFPAPDSARQAAGFFRARLR